MLVVIDTQTCNIESVCNALHRVGAAFATASDATGAAAADAIVLPGVGAIGPAMDALHARGIAKVLHRKVAEGAPILGICLGMQMLADESVEHGTHRGLGLVPGRVVRLEPSSPECRVPNIGWYACRARGGVLFPRAVEGASFYFVHSYYLDCAEPDSVAATIDYGGQDIVAAVERGNVFGVQFHPEKSQDHGLDLLDRFVSHVGARSPATPLR